MSGFRRDGCGFKVRGLLWSVSVAVLGCNLIALQALHPQCAKLKREV